MNHKFDAAVPGFVFSVTVYQTVTYFAAGLVASLALDYRSLFLMPVIGDYFRPFGSTEIFVGPLLQVVRGVLFGLVLLPFRGSLKEQRLGWLWLWLLFVGIGILGTPAAAPASLEGVIYSKLPLWFHLIGLPEILLQTLAFSVLVHRSLRAAEHPLPVFAQRLVQTLVLTCLSFIGYTVASLAFAFAVGVGVQSDVDLRVLGQFAGPVLVTFVVLLFRGAGWIVPNVAIYALSAASLALYQGLVLGSASLVYVLVAPVLPVAISLVLTAPRRAK